MDQAVAFRRLRVAGILAVAAIALVLLALGLLIYRRLLATINYSEVANLSGRRRLATMNVLYESERAATEPRNALRSGVDGLARARAAIDEPDSLESSIYARFSAMEKKVERRPFDRAARAELRALGFQLISRYDQLTANFGRLDELQRRRFLNLSLIAVGVALLALALLYVFVIRPSEARIRGTLLELESRRQRFAAMFDSSSEMMAIYDQHGYIVRANAAALRLLGFGLEAVGRHFTIHVGATAHEQVRREFEAACNGNASQFETTFSDVSGRSVPVLANMAPIVVEGEIVGVVGSANDLRALRTSEAELARSREHFSSLFDESPNAIEEISADGIIRAVNREFEVLTGYRAAELVGQSFVMLATPERRSLAHERFKMLLSGAAIYEGLLQCKDGTQLEVEIAAIPIRVGDDIDGVFIRNRNLTSERALARRIEQKDERIRALYSLASTSTDTMVDDAVAFGARSLNMPFGYVTQLSNGVLTIVHRFGLGDLLPIGLQMPVTSAIGARLAASPRAVAVEDLTIEPFASELRGRGLPWKSYIGSRIFVDNVPYGALVFMSESVRSEAFDAADFEFVDLMSGLMGTALAREIGQRRLADAASRDPLTGLLNRRALEEHARNVFGRARRTSTRAAVHYIDLDKFKAINDSYGHATGDEVLREVARRLSSVLRANDVVARIGGDEFVVMQSELTENKDIAALSDRLASLLVSPFAAVDGEESGLAASVGFAMFPEDGENLAALLDAADASMFAKKRSPKG